VSFLSTLGVLAQAAVGDAWAHASTAPDPPIVRHGRMSGRGQKSEI
jgi:hypothetical protein